MGEAHRRAALRTIESLSMKGIIDRGDHFERVIHALVLDKDGKFTVALKECQLRKDSTVLSGAPPITVTYSKVMTRDYTIERFEEVYGHIMKQVFQTIKESPKEIHDSYERAYFVAKDEHERKLRNKPAGQVDEASEDFKGIIMDEHLRPAQIKSEKMITKAQLEANKLRKAYKNLVSAQITADKMITKAQIKSKKFRQAYKKVVGNQTPQVEGHDTNPETHVFNLKVAFKEALEEMRASDVEKQISNHQTKVQLKAEKVIKLARIRAQTVEIVQTTKRNYIRNDGADEVDIEALLGFKENLLKSRI